MFVKDIGVKNLYSFSDGESDSWTEDRFNGQFISSYITSVN